MLSVYIGATILGVGITLFDLFGLLGGHEGSSDHGDALTDGSGDGAADGAADGADASDGDVIVHAGESDAAHGEEVDNVVHADSADVRSGSVVGHDRKEGRSLLISALTGMRYLIYFSLGFGPVGWFSLATSGSALLSLVWSVPVGAVALVGTRALRRFMRRELNSEVKSSELLMERGEVIVTIGRGELGRVRIKLGDIYVERFARAADADRSIRVGTTVRVTDVNDECVYVEEDD